MQLCAPWWWTSRGPKHVAVDVLKHYCDSNELCEFIIRYQLNHKGRNGKCIFWDVLFAWREGGVAPIFWKIVLLSSLGSNTPREAQLPYRNCMQSIAAQEPSQQFLYSKWTPSRIRPYSSVCTRNQIRPNTHQHLQKSLLFYHKYGEIKAKILVQKRKRKEWKEDIVKKLPKFDPLVLKTDDNELVYLTPKFISENSASVGRVSLTDLLTYLLTYLLTNLLTYLITHSLLGAEPFLRNQPVFS
jgi:hypothetical protein